jgi:hypothetical protein
MPLTVVGRENFEQGRELEEGFKVLKAANL